MEIKDLKVDLLCLGARVSGVDKGRKGGAGPAAGGMFSFGNTVTNVPTQSWFVSLSPYSVELVEGKYILKRAGERITEVRFPAAKFQELRTKDGISYGKIALLHGTNCVATTTIQTCAYWDTPKRCKFCAIELSLKSGATIAKKKPEQLAEVVGAAQKIDHVTHVTLTTGTTATSDKGIKHLAACASAIKEATGLPIHAQFEPPDELSMIDLLYESVDTIGIHVESFDVAVLKEKAPCKAEIPLQQFIEAWKRGVELFGETQVSSYIIAGLGERDESIIEGSRLLVELGVYPFLVPLRPIPGSDMEHEKPPIPDRMRHLYQVVGEILHERGMSWRRNKAGCVRCRACSALADFE
ncbi:MAG: MSMEG_0568 family radical SAM protein [Methanophagales archaeon ANME-1-THS]|nr:MAG: MSMEG_0568 family radical SAM protein [Methanophagales archaeon ANME-1-THS]